MPVFLQDAPKGRDPESIYAPLEAFGRDKTGRPRGQRLRQPLWLRVELEPGQHRWEARTRQKSLARLFFPFSLKPHPNTPGLSVTEMAVVEN